MRRVNDLVGLTSLTTWAMNLFLYAGFFIHAQPNGGSSQMYSMRRTSPISNPKTRLPSTINVLRGTDNCLHMHKCCYHMRCESVHVVNGWRSLVVEHLFSSGRPAFEAQRGHSQIRVWLLSNFYASFSLALIDVSVLTLKSVNEFGFANCYGSTA